jgi:hypothetical protein
MRRSVLTALLWSLCLAVFTCFVSNNLHPRFQNRAETIEEQLAITRGDSYSIGSKETYFAEFQNRVLFGFALSLAGSMKLLRLSQWYLVLRFLTAFAAFFLFWQLSTKHGKANTTASFAAMGLLAYCMIFTFNHGWEHPTDFLDIAFMTGFLGLTLQNRWGFLALLTLIASFNRESSAFAGVVWFFFHGFSAKGRPRVKHLIAGCALTLLALATVVSLRYLFGGEKALARQTFGLFWMPEMVRESLKNPLAGWITLLLAMAAPLALWLGAQWESINPSNRRLVASGIAVAMVSGSFSVMMELRTFLPAVTILLYVAAASGLPFLEDKTCQSRLAKTH